MSPAQGRCGSGTQNLFRALVRPRPNSVFHGHRKCVSDQSHAPLWQLRQSLNAFPVDDDCIGVAPAPVRKSFLHLNHGKAGELDFVFWHDRGRQGTFADTSCTIRGAIATSSMLPTAGDSFDPQRVAKSRAPGVLPAGDPSTSAH
jgi:hypothetical protein